jgi:hypothetical protein
MDRLGSDLIHTAEASPTGLAMALNAAYAANPIDPAHFGHVNLHPAGSLLQTMALQTAHDVRHPLRHPGLTALDAIAVASLGAGAGFRVAAGLGEAGAASRAAAGLVEAGAASRTAAVARALVKNPALTSRRTISVPGDAGRATFEGNYSRSGIGMASQKATDALLQRGANLEGRAGRVAQRGLHGRAAKWNERAAKVEDSTVKAAGHRALVAGHRLNLDDAQQRALRIVAETVPYPRALRTIERNHADAITEASKAEAKLESAEERGLSKSHIKGLRKAVNQAHLAVSGTADRLQWTRDAGQYLTEEGATGRPLIHPDHPELADASRLVQEAAGSRESMLKGLNLMDEESFQAAKTKVARVAAGARYVKPTAARLGNIKGLAEASRRVKVLEDRFQRRIAQTKATGFGAVERPRTATEAAARLDDLEREHTIALDALAHGKFGPIDMSEVRRRSAENKRARLQAAGVTRSGRRSGASGRKSILRPTVKEERRTLIDQMVADAIEKNPDHPTLQRWKARTSEMDQLRDALTPSVEEAFGGAAREPDYGTVSEFRSEHPSVQRLGSALSVARDELERLQGRADAHRVPTGLVGAEDVEAHPEAAFIGSPVEQPRRFGVGKRVTSSNTLGHTRNRGSLKEFTGKARVKGLERNDVTRLIAERQYEAAGLTHLSRMVDRLQGAGTAVPRHANDVFLWTDGKVISTERLDPEVKNFLQGAHDENATRAFSDEELKAGGLKEALRKALMETPLRGGWQMHPDRAEALRVAAENGQGVFVPRALLGRDAPKAGMAATDLSQMKWLSNVNNFEKLGLIYLKVNYPIVQGLSNIALNLIQQGAYAPRNLALAARLGKKMGPETAMMVDDAIEQGLAGQLAGTSKGAFGRFSQGASQVATTIADKVPRRAAWLHEAYRQGYRTSDQVHSLLTDPEKMGDLVQVTQRAKEAIVDFGDLGPVEKNFVRQLVFVYPWLKGATKYTGRFVRDHPLQAAVLGQLGQMGAERNQQVFGDRPSYMQNLVPIGGRAIDLSSLNPFSTPADMGRTAAAFAQGKWGASPPSQYLSPGAQAVVDLIRRRDSGNFPLKGSLPVQLRNELLSQLPLAQLAASAPGPQGDIVRKLLGTPMASKSFPNQQRWQRFIGGGLWPRTFDPAAMNRSAAYESSQASR